MGAQWWGDRWRASAWPETVALASLTRPLELSLVDNQLSGVKDREGGDETSHVRSRAAGRSDQRHGSRGRHRRSARGFRPFSAGARDHRSINYIDASTVGES